jgi:hypothetical protein
MERTGTGKAFAALIHKAMRVYHCDEALAGLPRLHNLRLVAEQRRRQPHLSLGTAIRQVLKAGLQRLAQDDSTAADLLERRFVEEEMMVGLAHDYGYAVRTLYRKQNEALIALAQRLWEAEEAARRRDAAEEARRSVLDRLPPPTYSRLFGVEQQLADLTEMLSDDQRYWLISVEGMGGVGKTALARAAVVEALSQGHFAQVVWTTAQQQAFAWGERWPLHRPPLTLEGVLDDVARQLGAPDLPPSDREEKLRRIRQLVRAQPTLIVVDNLETAAEFREIASGIYALARPAKLLVTSRHRLGAYHQVTTVDVQPLDFKDGLAFIRYHADDCKVPHVTSAPVAQQARIQEVSGGNPLAIKLVIGQTRALPLSRVLTDLEQARGRCTEFYLFIFRYSWEHLSEVARQVLVCMPLLDPRGATWEDIAGVCGIQDEDVLCAALVELVDASLLNRGQRAGQIEYSIHRLTEHFVLSDIVGISPESLQIVA